MAAKIIVDTSVLAKWIKTKDEDLINEARLASATSPRSALFSFRLFKG